MAEVKPIGRGIKELRCTQKYDTIRNQEVAVMKIKVYQSETNEYKEMEVIAKYKYIGENTGKLLMMYRDISFVKQFFYFISLALSRPAEYGKDR